MSYHPSPAAYHESGHALVACVYQRGPLKVELIGDETGKTEALAINRGNRPYHVINLPSLPT